jgi:hypothetical protein
LKRVIMKIEEDNNENFGADLTLVARFLRNGCW